MFGCLFFVSPLKPFPRNIPTSAGSQILLHKQLTSRPRFLLTLLSTGHGKQETQVRAAFQPEQRGWLINTFERLKTNFIFVILSSSFSFYRLPLSSFILLHVLPKSLTNSPLFRLLRRFCLNIKHFVNLAPHDSYRRANAFFLSSFLSTSRTRCVFLFLLRIHSQGLSTFGCDIFRRLVDIFQ